MYLIIMTQVVKWKSVFFLHNCLLFLLVVYSLDVTKVLRHLCRICVNINFAVSKFNLLQLGYWAYNSIVAFPLYLIMYMYNYVA